MLYRTMTADTTEARQATSSPDLSFPQTPNGKFRCGVSVSGFPFFHTKREARALYYEVLALSVLEVESIAMATSLLMNAMIMTRGPLVEFASCCFCPFKFPGESRQSF